MASGPTTIKANLGSGFAAGPALHLDPPLAPSTQLPGWCSKAPGGLLLAHFAGRGQDADDAVAVEAFEHAQKMQARDGDAAGGCRVAGTGDVQEDGAAMTLHARARIVVEG